MRNLAGINTLAYFEASSYTKKGLYHRHLLLTDQRLLRVIADDVTDGVAHFGPDLNGAKLVSFVKEVK